MKNYINRLNEIIIKGAKIERINSVLDNCTNLVNDLGYDSLSFISLMMSIESEFDIEFDINIGYKEVSQYEQLKKYVLEKLASKNSCQ